MLQAVHGLAQPEMSVCPQALETSHAIAFLDILCPDLPGSQNIVINCSGRGDKDVNTAIQLLGM
jgi:tryptophan synthase beta chain